jgi:pullulanase
MKYMMLLLLPVLMFSQAAMKEYPVYDGNDLGVTYTKGATTFKVWAPDAEAVKVRLYNTGSGGNETLDILMDKESNGVWKTIFRTDIKNKYYTFKILHQGKWLAETPDPYAKAVGVNGRRGMVVDMKDTNPEGWESDKGPVVKHPTDILLYESHVRDLSVSNNSGIKHKGKFLGIAETGTKSPDGLSTGLDHLKELGVTHLHLLPAFDFNSVDEANPEGKYNWGYDPLNYNVPEGSFSTNPNDGNVRIKEFKQMVQALHANGLGVIMDVVYNHTSGRDTPFNLTAPDYYYRKNPDGSYSDASGCGNETASERPMMRKFMIESVVYWAKEYHVDGFRFDLMGVHDIETMNAISDALHKINPSIIIYGEGWTAGACPIPETKRAVKKNAHLLDRIAAFSDDLRDGLRGPYNDVRETGFVSAKKGTAESVKFGIVASVAHPQIDYKAVNYSKEPWAAEPYHTVSYVSCHDDNTLFDRLKIGNPIATEAELIKMDKLAQCVVLTSQGIPFLHSGAELLRTKQGMANSYKSPDAINEIDWSRKSKYGAVFNYYKALTALRKNHPAFRMPTAKMIQEHLKFIDTGDPLLIQYQISGNANDDVWKNIIVVFNGDRSDKEIVLPAGKWAVALDGSSVNEKGIRQASAKPIIPATEALILYQLN